MTHSRRLASESGNLRNEGWHWRPRREVAKNHQGRQRTRRGKVKKG